MIDILLLVLAGLIGAIIYALIIKALPGSQPGEEQFAKIEQLIRDAAAKAQEASNKANTASIIAAQAAQKVEAAATVVVAQPKPVEPPPAPPVVVPPEPAPVPEPPPPAPPPPPVPQALQVVYANREALLAACAGYQYAVMLDGAPVHVGFGPPDMFWTHGNGMVSQTKPVGDTEIIIEGT